VTAGLAAVVGAANGGATEIAGFATIRAFYIPNGEVQRVTTRLLCDFMSTYAGSGRGENAPAFAR
jgi:hypothetical protein